MTTKIDSEKIAQKLKEYRATNNLDLATAQRILNIPQELILAIESEKIDNISPQTLAKIATARRENIDTFLTDRESDKIALSLGFPSWSVKPFNWLGINGLPNCLKKLKGRKILHLYISK